MQSRRKADIQTEETIVSSPLRRSSRINISTNPSASNVTSIKDLQSTAEVPETKAPKTRRGSLLQENSDKDEKKENKPIPRGRRGSTAKEETEQKVEPAKTRSRRSSATAEPVKVEEAKPVSKRRRSSAAEELPESETVRPLRGRSSMTAKPEEEDSEKKNLRGNRTSAKEEIVKEETTKKPVRGRRSSITDKPEENADIDAEKEKKRPTRGRRASTDKLEDEPEAKIGRLAPSKTKRRLSITDNAVNLESIEEQEIENKNRKSTSPIKTELEVLNTPAKRDAPGNKLPLNETKTARSTPVKSRRRLSVTENAVNLESIKEQESEMNARKSISPVKTDLKVVLTSSSPNLKPIEEQESEGKARKSRSPIKTDMDDLNTSPSKSERSEPNEPPLTEIKTRSTPVKSEHLFVTENTVSLESVNEQESETKATKSNSSTKTDLKVVSTSSPPNCEISELITEDVDQVEVDVTMPEEPSTVENSVSIAENNENVLDQKQEEAVMETDCSPTKIDMKAASLTPTKKNDPGEIKTNFDLSVIKETSFIEEHSDGNRSQKCISQSPKLHKKASPDEPITVEHSVSIAENNENVLDQKQEEAVMETNSSPTKIDMKVASLTPTKKNDPGEIKMNFDLSVIKETSFIEEHSDGSRSQKRISQSPKLHKKASPSPEKLRTSPRLMKHVAKETEKKDTLEDNVVVEENIKEKTKLESINEDNSVEKTLIDTRSGDENMEKTTSEKCTIQESNTSTFLNGNDIHHAESTNDDCKTETEILMSQSNETVEVTECSRSSVADDKSRQDTNDVMSTSKVDCPNISTGSDGSFRFHLNMSLPGTNSQNLSQSEDIEQADDMNILKTIKSTNKENMEINIPLNVTEPQEPRDKMTDVSNSKTDDMIQEKPVQDIVVARISNVFRPKMEENSFMEPMDVDEFPSMLENTQDNLQLELEEHNTEDHPYAKSTPIVLRRINKLGIGKTSTESEKEKISHKQRIEVEESKSVDESFKLSLSISHVSPQDDELEIGNKSNIDSEATEGVDITMNESSAESVRVQEKPATAGSQPDNTEDVLEPKEITEAKEFTEVMSMNSSENPDEPSSIQETPLKESESILDETSGLESQNDSLVKEDYKSPVMEQTLALSRSPESSVDRNAVAPNKQDIKKGNVTIPTSSDSQSKSEYINLEEIKSDAESGSDNVFEEDKQSEKISLKIIGQLKENEAKENKSSEESSYQHPINENSETVGALKDNELDKTTSTQLEQSKISIDQPKPNPNCPEEEPRLTETSKMDISDEYEFDLPSDEDIENQEPGLENVTKGSGHLEDQTADINSSPLQKNIANSENTESGENNVSSKKLKNLEGYNITKIEIEKVQLNETLKKDCVNKSIDLKGGKKIPISNDDLIEGSSSHTKEQANDVSKIAETEDSSRTNHIKEIQVKEGQSNKSELEDQKSSKNMDYEEMKNDFKDLIQDHNEQQTTKEVTLKEYEQSTGNCDEANVNYSDVNDNNKGKRRCKTIHIPYLKKRSKKILVTEKNKSSVLQKTEKTVNQSSTSRRIESETIKETPEIVKDIELENESSSDKVKTKKDKEVFTHDNSKNIDEEVNEIDNIEVKTSKKKFKKSTKKMESMKGDERVELETKEVPSIPEIDDENDNDSVETQILESPKKKRRLKSKSNSDSSISQGEYQSNLNGLEPFTNSEIDQYLLKKITELKNESGSSEDASDIQDGESDKEENEFLFTMAEEGEEDTPSEGSNDIIDEGESINSTESEVDSDDEYDENDSFICDEEAVDLLSGDEYDLGDEREQKKTKKSRIIDLDDYDDDVIEIKRKEKVVEPRTKKRSRIISISDSSDTEADKHDEQHEENPKVEKIQSPQSTISDIQDKEMVHLDDVKSEPKLPTSEICHVTSESENENQSKQNKRKSSITIHENISVSEIKDAALSERITNLVDSFCTSIRQGEISMNLSLEYALKDNSEESQTKEEETTKDFKKRKLEKNKQLSSPSDDILEPKEKNDQIISKSSRKRLRKRKSAQKRNAAESTSVSDTSENISPKRADRLNITLDNIEDLNESHRRLLRKRRVSKSLENLSEGIIRKKKKTDKKWKKEMISKKELTRPRKSRRNKRRSSSENDLRTQTFSIMNQLITDVKNRPTRTIFPTKEVSDMNSSWITEIADVKPSTTIISRRDRTEYKSSSKIHPKDFRTQMLYDPARVRRVDTKTLLKKKGAYF